MPAVENHEGHADREQACDRHLSHDVEQIDGRQEPRLDEREHRHQRDKEQRGREFGDEAENIHALGVAGSIDSGIAHRTPRWAASGRSAAPW